MTDQQIHDWEVQERRPDGTWFNMEIRLGQITKGEAHKHLLNPFFRTFGEAALRVQRVPRDKEWPRDNVTKLYEDDEE